MVMVDLIIKNIDLGVDKIGWPKFSTNDEIPSDAFY